MTPEELDRVLEHLDDVEDVSFYNVGGETWSEGGENVPDDVLRLLSDVDGFVRALRQRAAVRRLLSDLNQENDDE